jgi:hypothetical protein
MKYLQAPIFVMLFIASLAAQPQQEILYVIHIKGIMTNLATSKQIRVGDALKPTDKISFIQGKAAAVVMSTQKGRFTIGRPAQASSSATGEFIAFVKNTLVPATSVGNLSTRGDLTAPCTDNLKEVLGNEAFVFPADQAVLCLDRNVYPMNQNNFFIYRTHNGEREINYMIPFMGDSLLIGRDTFHATPKGDVVGEARAEIYYFDKLQNSSVKIATITPVFADAEELKTECGFLVQLYKKQNLSRAEIVVRLTEHVQSVYLGRTDEAMLDRWLQAKRILEP